jgi:hypothetical protein
VTHLSAAMLGDIRNAFAKVRSLTSGDPADEWATLQRELDADYAEKRRRWDAQAPMRAQAEEAFRRANERRARELGVSALRPGAVMCSWPNEPTRTVIRL